MSPTRQMVFSSTRPFSGDDLGDDDFRIDGVADPHRRAEVQRLRQIDGPGSRQDRERGGKEARRQHAVHDPALEAGRPREVLIEMQRVVIAGEVGEGMHIGIGEGMPIRGLHADGELLDRVGPGRAAARNIIHEPPLSPH